MLDRDKVSYCPFGLTKPVRFLAPAHSLLWELTISSSSVLSTVRRFLFRGRLTTVPYSTQFTYLKCFSIVDERSPYTFVLRSFAAKGNLWFHGYPFHLLLQDHPYRFYTLALSFDAQWWYSLKGLPAIKEVCIWHFNQMGHSNCLMVGANSFQKRQVICLIVRRMDVIFISICKKYPY